MCVEHVRCAECAGFVEYVKCAEYVEYVECVSCAYLRERHHPDCPASWTRLLCRKNSPITSFTIA